MSFPIVPPRSATRRVADTDRRRFLIGSTASGLALPAWANRVHAIDTQPSSGRLRLAGIGVGGKGASDLAELSSHDRVDVVALCDIDAGRLHAAAEKHPGARRFTDFRQMFDQVSDDIDAVHVSTPDHTHAPAAMTAMKRGKHVYCQKPLTHDVFEARQLRLAAAEQNVVTQMGTQVHSHTAYRTAVKLVRSGVIGKVREVHSWCDKAWGYNGPAPIASPVPEGIAWDLWLGTAPERPYAAGQYHPSNWRRWYDFGCGTMGDMSIHILDPVFTALELTAPLSVISSSSEPPAESYGLQNQTRFVFPPTPHTTQDFVLTWSDGGLKPDVSSWPSVDGQSRGSGKADGLPKQGSMFVGEKGYVLLPHIGGPILLPAADFANFEIEAVEGASHYHRFVDACLGGEPTTAHFGYAGPLTEAVLLGVIANRFPGNSLAWNADELTIPNHAAAAALLRRPYRAGFEVEGL